MEPKQNNIQLWIWLVMEVKSDAIKSNIAQEPGMLGPWIKANWSWQEWTVNENRLDWVNLTQMTIISTSVGKNPLEEME